MYLVVRKLVSFSSTAHHLRDHEAACRTLQADILLHGRWAVMTVRILDVRQVIE